MLSRQDAVIMHSYDESRNDYLVSDIQKPDLSYVKNLFWMVFAA
jgi:hypothetical protein